MNLYSPLWLSAQLAFVTTLILLCVATPIAWWLSQSTSRLKAVAQAVVALPIVLPPGEETLEVVVRFTPQSLGDPLMPDEFLGLLTIVSDDPDAAGTADLCGEGVAQSGIRTLVTDISTGLPVPVGERALPVPAAVTSTTIAGRPSTSNSRSERISRDGRFNRR